MPVFFATDRAKMPSPARPMYTTDRERSGRLHLGRIDVRRPESHATIEVSDEDLDKFFDSQAQQFSQPTSDIRDAYQRAGQMSAVRSEIKKSKALEWVLEHVNIVDEDGSLVDRGALVLPSDLAGEHDHEHEHDHDHHNDHDETPARTGEE